MTELDPRVLHDPNDYIGQDGRAAARLVHFADDRVFDRSHPPLPPHARQVISAFVSHASEGAAKDSGFFTEDFGPDPFENPGWCRSVTHYSLKSAAELLRDADEWNVRGDRHGNTYTIKTLSQRFTVQRVQAGPAWDLMQEIVLGTIVLTSEVKIGQPKRLQSFRSTFQPLWFWQQRRKAPPLSATPHGEVPDSWRNAKTIPAGYLELPMID